MYPLSLSRFLNDQVQSKRIFSSNLKEYRSDNSLDQNLIFHGWRTGHCSPGQNETWIPAYPRGSLSRGVFRGSCLPLPLPPSPSSRSRGATALAICETGVRHADGILIPRVRGCWYTLVHKVRLDG